MEFPPYIQKAVDLGLLIAEDGKIIDCRKDEVDTVMGMARLVEKLQPTSATDEIDTEDQEAIVLCRVLNANTEKAHELWGDLRIAFGIGHGQAIPDALWTNGVLRAIGKEIDRTFIGDRNSSVISKENLIHSYGELQQSNQPIGITDFSKAITELSDKNRMADYGDKNSEWKVALDLLRQQRVRAIYTQTRAAATQAEKAKAKLSKQIEFEQSQLMLCLGMLNGQVGNQGNHVDMVTQLLAPEKPNESVINRMMLSRSGVPPVSTGIKSFDIDMQGGVRRDGQEQGGRLFTLGARTGVGKTILAVQATVNLAMNGLTVGFISAEMDQADISARLWSAASTYKRKPNGTCDGWVPVARINDPSPIKKEEDVNLIGLAAHRMLNNNGKLLIESPWGADVDAVINTLRSMKSKSPKLRFVAIDHFHCLGRHQGAPHSDSAMLEERAYKLMTAAKELSIDLFVLAQLNRTGMGNDVASKDPDETWIRGTDALSHISHAVWIIRRETVDEKQSKTEKRLEVHHVKNRGNQYLNINGKDCIPDKHIGKSFLTMDYSHSIISYDSIAAENGWDKY
jgi:replicative DNA helicase